jgi:hypothetical protein
MAALFEGIAVDGVVPALGTFTVDFAGFEIGAGTT